jgi:hypothetical protein
MQQEIHHEKNQERMNTICQMFLKMGEGNFAYRIARTGNNDKLESVAILVNLLAKKMEESVSQLDYIYPLPSHSLVAQGVFRVNSKFEISNISAEVTTVTGYNADQLIGKDFAEILVKESLPLLEKVKTEIIANKSYNNIVSLEFITIHKLSILVSCIFSKLSKSQDMVITLFTPVNDNVMGKKS